MKAATASLLDKAATTIDSASLLADAGDSLGAAGRAYYAMFYVAEALLFEEGQSYGKHSAVHAAIGRDFVKTGRLDERFHRDLLDAFDIRIRADYEVDAAVSLDQARTQIGRAREFLAAVRTILSR